MHLMRDDEYEPLKMNYRWGPKVGELPQQTTSGEVRQREVVKKLKIDRETRIAIAAAEGTSVEVGLRFGVASQTVRNIKREFRLHEETHAQATQAGQGEKASGNRGVSRGAAAGHAADEKAAERRPEEKPANPERLGSRVMRAIQDWLL